MYRTQSVVELRKLVRDKGTGIPGTLIANAGLDDLAAFLESTDKGGLDADGAGAAFATSVNARIAARPPKPKKKAKAKAKAAVNGKALDVPVTSKNITLSRAVGAVLAISSDPQFLMEASKRIAVLANALS